MKNQRRNKNNSLFFTVLFVTAICLLALTAVIVYFGMSQKPESSEVKPVVLVDLPESSSEPEPEPEPKTIKLLAVGDNLIHDGLYIQAREFANGDGYDFSYSYQNIAERITAATVAMINQETIIDREKPPSPYPLFNSPPEVGEEMVEIGFDVISIANNHSYDKGESGLRSCLNFWQEQPVEYVGAYEGQADLDRVRVVEREGIKLGFVAFTEATNGLSISSESDLILVLQKNEDLIKELIEKTRAVADVVIVNAHWGIEYTHIPNDTQRYMAQKLADWGADIIIGNHPHVIQPIEYITCEDGREAIVAYSLGNFISMQSYGPRMLGGMVELEITKTGDEIELGVPLFTPVITHYDYGFKNGTVFLAEDYTEEYAKRHGCLQYSPDFGLDYIKKTVNSVIDKRFLSPEAWYTETEN